MDRRPASALGFVLRVVGGTTGGTAVGALGGLLLTAINNLVLAPRFGAAEGSCGFWAVFFAKLLLLPSVVGSILWGLAFLRKQPRGSAGASTKFGQ